MLDRLVLTDLPTEDHSLLRVGAGAIERRLAEPDSLGGDQDALGVHAVQDVLEASALLADAVGLGNAQAVDEQHVRIDGMATDASGVVRVRISILSATCAVEIHALRPEMT